MIERVVLYVILKAHCHSGGEEDSGRCMRRGQRGGHREERTATVVATKQGSITFKREFSNKKGRIYLKRSSLKGSFLI